MGWAGTGVHFDPVIADNAAHWLAANATTLDQPWFLTVALVNPHDVMWFPIDQPAYRADHPDELRVARELLAASRWMEGGDVLPAYGEDYPEVVDRLPANFGDDLISKPACQRQWRWDQQHGIWGFIDPADREPGAGTSTTTCGSTSWPTGRWAPCWPRSRRRARGTTRSSSSRPTTATCAARTACGRRGRSSTTRS